jgi:hypothetical protein
VAVQEREQLCVEREFWKLKNENKRILVGLSDYKPVFKTGNQTESWLKTGL